MKIIISKLLVLIFILSLCSCDSDQGGRIDDFSSPRSLFVDHIASFTGGVISVTSPIRLRLAKPAGDSLSGKQIDFTVFSFSPGISGSSYWEDNRTVVFNPDDQLKPGQKYEVSADLKKLIPNVDGDKEEFNFIFQTLVQNFEVSLDGLQLYDNTDLTRLKITGQLQTADFTSFENIQKMLSASQSGNQLQVTWTNTGKDNLYNFMVDEVKRTDSEQEVELTIKGDPINVDKQESLEVQVPSLSDYKVVSSRVVRGDDNYISILFSDPLDSRQNLVGLVQMTNLSNRPRLVTNLNELKIYPTEEIRQDIELTINRGIRNIAGHRLEEDYKTKIQFNQSKPEVRLIGENSNKAILPSAKGLVLPFEAVGLSAVEVTVVRIYEDNMLQYLQVNSMGGNYELRRVAQPVSKKVIPLNTSGVTNLNSWNRFTLNLEDVVRTEPGAAYQINIGFRKRHSLYFCANDDNIQELDEDLDEWQAPEESSYWDYAEYYYNSGYDWNERDNPCSDSYYGNRRSVSKMVFASDFGIIAKRRDGGALNVFLSDLITTAPLSGVDLKVYDYQQQEIGTNSTGSDGKAVLEVTGKPFVLVAKKGEQTGYLKLDDGSSLSLSNFDVTGTRIQKGLKGFLYGERGVWRPADTVHLGFILEDATNTLPDNHPVILELYNPMDQLYSRKVSAEPVGDIYRFDMVTTSDAPTGNWRAEAKVGGASFSKTVKIETIKPNRLKVDLDFGRERLTANNSTITGDLNVRWLTGATASNLKAEFELLLSPVKTTFKDYPNFIFDDQSRQFYSERELVFDGKVNSAGYARVNVNIGGFEDAPGALNALFLGKVYEEGGDFSVKNLSIPYYPYNTFVGVKAPDGDRRGILLTDKDHPIRIVTVDSDGNPVSRRNLEVELYKLNWKWWWDNSYDNISNYVGRSYREPVQKDRVSTSGGETTWSLRIDYPEWGRYYIRVKDPASEHSTGQVVYIDWPGWAGKGKRGDLDGASMLDFGIEKEEYKVGEQIALSIPSTEGNRILVSLETGSEVLQTFWVEAEQDNTAISFEATSDMAPNIYAHLTMIQPHGQTSNDLPIRLYGVQSIKVTDPGTLIEPTIDMPAELGPEQSYVVEIAEKNRKPMAYTIAVVDEGLLDITNFTTPDPWSSFYQREALGIKTWDVYDDVMGSFSGSLDYLLAIGGDGVLEQKEETEANRFKPVVQYLGPFYLEAGKTRSHNLTMPQYIGSVKTMVIAAGNGAYGSAEQVTPVKQPLMALATLPRVAGPGEDMKLPVNVFVLDDKINNVNVKIETSGALTSAGKDTQSITFNKAGDQVVYFDIKAQEALGVGKVKVTTSSGNLTATYDVEMNVIPRNPQITDVDSKILGAGETWEIAYAPIGLLSQNAGTIEVSSLPPLNIDQRLKYLVRYPHGCIEQTTSAVFAQLFLSDLVDLNDDKKQEIQRNIDAGIDRLRSFQLPSGGFSYWPGNDYPNHWGSNYAGHFLVEAKDRGYGVPENILSNWIAYQTQQADSWDNASSDSNHDLIQAYRLYTLAKAGSPALGAMNRLKENTSIKRESKWRLALAYAIAGYDQQATNLVENLSTSPDTLSASRYRYSFGSRTRDRAMIMETLLELGQKEQAFEILMEIAKKMGNKDQWLSTQTTAYCFISIAKYAKGFPIEEQTNVEVTVSGESSAISGNDFINQVILNDPDQQSNISMSNNGGAPIFARLIRSGIPIEGTDEAIERNIRFSVDYTDMQGNRVDVSRLSQGTNFMAEVTVSHPGVKGEYSELALTQIFPSGWEIINTRLEGTATQQPGDQAKYVDIRDDRVMHYFDLAPNKNATYTVLLNAAYQGRYYLPAVSIEAMYDNSVFASKEGRWINVLPEN